MHKEEVINGMGVRGDFTKVVECELSFEGWVVITFSISSEL